MFLDDVDYLAFKYIHCIHLIRCTDCISAYAHCIIQDRKLRTQSSYPRSLRSSSRCSRRKCPKPTRRTLRNFRSAPITARAPSREASPGAFSPDLQLLIQCFTLIDALRSGVVCNRCCIILVYLCYTISLLPWYPQSSQCLAGLDR